MIALYNSVSQSNLAFTEHDFRAVNGYPNEYWGWGGEDDDLWSRTNATDTVDIVRPESSLYRYKMIPHETEGSNAINPRRRTLLKSWEHRWDIDGLRVSLTFL